MMLRLILISLLNLFSYNVTPEPVRLQKKLSYNEKIRVWYCKHEMELLVILIFVMMIVFVWTVFTFVPSMDMWNNHFEEVI